MSKKVNYEGQIFGNRKIIKNECVDEDFRKMGLTLPTETTKKTIN